MPDNLPTHPDFGYFTERPDQRLSDDVNDFHQAEPPDLEYTLPGLPALVYPLRQNDAADEVERLTAQLEAARAEFIRIYPPLPVFMQERLEGLRVLLGVER